MNRDLFKILKELKQVQPNPDYSKRSKLFILNSQKSTDFMTENQVLKPKQLGDILSIFRSYKPAFATGTIAFLIIAAVSVYYINNSLNKNNLVVKAGEINASIQVRLDEIKYLLGNKPNLDSANALVVQVMLEKAANNLKEVSSFGSENNNLSESLDKIKSTEDLLYQIDTILKAQN